MIKRIAIRWATEWNSKAATNILNKIKLNTLYNIFTILLSIPLNVVIAKSTRQTIPTAIIKARDDFKALKGTTTKKNINKDKTITVISSYSKLFLFNKTFTKEITLITNKILERSISLPSIKNILIIELI